jgi:site-specific recombinase XerC
MPPISIKLASMLAKLPKDVDAIFGQNSDLTRRNFKQRKRISAKLKNARIKQITFHTFRHWKATMEYHKTRDILHVMQLIGHKNINNTLVCTQLIDFRDDDYIARIADSEQEACQLIEVGFEFACDFAGNKLFRKRK